VHFKEDEYDNFEFKCGKVFEKDKGKDKVFKEKDGCEANNNACGTTIPRKAVFVNVHWISWRAG